MDHVSVVPEGSDRAEDPTQTRENDYDGFVEAYSADTENNLVNTYYARPAMLGLVGDVAGRRVLDAGCGSGPLLCVTAVPCAALPGGLGAAAG